MISLAANLYRDTDPPKFIYLGIYGPDINGVTGTRPNLNTQY